MDINNKDNKKYKSYTHFAVDMLCCILQRITYEVAESPDKKQDYYNEMASISVVLADAINQIENNAEPVVSNFVDESINIDYME